MFNYDVYWKSLGVYNLGGSPPLVVSLSGMGFAGLDNIPVGVTNITASYPDNVDYLTIAIPGLNGELTKIPAQMIISVNLQPMFSRAYASAFGLKDFSYGKTRLLGPNPTFPTASSVTETPTNAGITTIPLQRDTSLDNNFLETTPLQSLPLSSNNSTVSPIT